MSLPDPKPEPRVKDPGILRALHQRWRDCALCGKVSPLSLHHISKHPRDDLEGNLVMLCGDGVSGCHGMIEAGQREMRAALGLHILRDRPDVLDYLARRFGEQLMWAWLRRTYYVEL